MLLAYIREALWTGWSVGEQSGSAWGAQFPPEVKARQGQKLGRGHEEDTEENENLSLSDWSIC